VQPTKQRDRPAGGPLGQQDPGQQQVGPLVGVVGLVVGTETTPPGQAQGFGRVAAGEQQPGPL
jgi:hypothetical protein